MGVAVWCAAGTLTVVSATEASHRVANPAPWWVLAAAIVLAALVPVWRRRPTLTWPALLSVLPWLPLPLPAVALVWTGPLAWLPILLALVLAATPAIRARVASLSAVVASPARATTVAAAVTLAVGLITAMALAPRLLDGDEPHYLIITESLLRDGDLRIENNHDRRDYAAFFDGTLARPDFIQRSVDGEIYSIHAPGVAVLVLPLHALFGFRGAQALVLLCAALTGALVWRTAWRATGDAGAAWFAWASIALSATFLVQSVTIYPDGPGMLAVAAGAWLIVRLGQVRVRTWTVVGVSALLAGLPWLHTRFAIIAGLLGALIVSRLWRETTATAAGRTRRVLAFAAVPTLTAVGWFGYFWTIYGTLNPASPYGTNAGADTSWTFVPGGLLGILFDQQFGLMVYTPVLLAALLGSARRPGSISAGLPRTFGVAVLCYLAAIGLYWMWWAGVPAPPARFITAVLPLLCVAQAAVWTRASGPARLVWAGLLLLSVGMSILLLAVGRGDLVWNVRDAHARWLDWLGPVVSLARGWPSFFWDLTPQVVSSEWPFALHVLVAAAVWISGALVVRAWLRRTGTAEVSRQASVLAAGFVATMMIFVQAGWWLTSGAPLNPVRSQVSVLRASARGGPTVDVRPMRIARIDHRALTMELRPDLARAPEIANVEWARFEVVPAGRYEVRVTTRRPARGRLTLQGGRSAATWQTFELQGLSSQTFLFATPVDVTQVSLVPDAQLAEIGGTVVLVPRVSRPAVASVARAVLRLETGDVFVLDQAALVEPDGFWVAGGAATEVIVAAGPAARVVTLRLGNGGSINRVVVASGAYEETVALEPFEGRVVMVPAGPGGVTVVRLTSPGSFRPSDDGRSQDRRSLGVRVQ